MAPRLRAALADAKALARDNGPLFAGAVALDRVLPLGLQRFFSPRLVAPAWLLALVARLLRAWGLSEQHAAVCAERILYADLRGIDSHGCATLAFYRRLLDAGRLNPQPKISTLREDAATAVLDGDRGLGHVPATLAMQRAIEKCRATGVAAVGVRNSGHFGAAGAYTALAAEAGVIGLATTSTPTPAVVPTYGRDAVLGTNPISVAVPALRNPPFLLDMATSTVSHGKLLERWRSGRSLPQGWALDAQGGSLTDGRAAAEARRLTPLGSDPDGSSYKGYGLAVAVEILSSLLPGTAPAGESPRPVGHFFLAIDPKHFRDSGFGEDVDRLLDVLRASRPAEAERPVRVAGDPEREALVERSARGIPVNRLVFEDLRRLARAAGVAFLPDEP